MSGKIGQSWLSNGLRCEYWWYSNGNGFKHVIGAKIGLGHGMDLNEAAPSCLPSAEMSRNTRGFLHATAGATSVSSRGVGAMVASPVTSIASFISFVLDSWSSNLTASGTAVRVAGKVWGDDHADVKLSVSNVGC